MIAAKTTTCANLGIGLAREGKRVLLVDCDPFMQQSGDDLLDSARNA